MVDKSKELGVQMMVLCDVANVRDGLLNVLGAGISFMQREDYPAPLNVNLAILFEAPSTLGPEGLKFKLGIRNHGTGRPIADDLPFEFGAHPDAEESPFFAMTTVPLVLSLEQMILPEPAVYEIQLSINGDTAASLRFEAAIP